MARTLRRTFRILEATTATDYNALSAGQKDAYKMILSCGLVDLAEGAPMKIRLWDLFGEETDTYANLESLLEAPPIEE